MMSANKSEEILKNFGSVVKKKRELLGWSQQYMADQLNISQSYYCFIEKGARTLSAEMMLEIASILQIELHSFFVLQIAQKQERKDRRVQLLLKASSVEALDYIAKQKGKSRNDLIQTLIDTYLLFGNNMLE